MKRIEALMEAYEKVFMQCFMPAVSLDSIMDQDPEDYKKMKAVYDVYKQLKTYVIEQTNEIDEMKKEIKELLSLVKTQTNEIESLKGLVKKTGELLNHDGETLKK